MTANSDWDREWQRVLQQMPPLHRAAHTGQNEEILAALAEGAEINAPDPHGYYLLSGAASGGHVETVRLLLAQGANPNLAGPSGGTPLMTAASFGRVEIVRLLIAGGADLNPRGFSGETALLRVSGGDALEGERQDRIRQIAVALIEAGADVNIANRRGTTPLMHFLRPGFADVLRMLLERGADVHARDADGLTAMDHAATKQGWFADADDEVVALLLEHGAPGTNAAGVPLFARRDAPPEEVWNSYWARTLKDPFLRGMAFVTPYCALLERYLAELRRRRVRRLLLPGNGCSLLPHALVHLGFEVTVVEISSFANRCVAEVGSGRELLAHFLPGLRKQRDGTWIADPRRSQARAAREAAPGGSLTLITADILSWEAEAPFDALYDDRLAMVLPRESWPELAAKYRKLLRPEGLCLVETINLGAFEEQTPSTRDVFEAAFTSAGFQKSPSGLRLRKAAGPTVEFIHGSG